MSVIEQLRRFEEAGRAARKADDRLRALARELSDEICKWPISETQIYEKAFGCYAKREGHLSVWRGTRYVPVFADRQAALCFSGAIKRGLIDEIKASLCADDFTQAATRNVATPRQM